MAYGVTDTGFITKRFADIVTELKTAYRSEFGDINTDDDSVIGQEINLQALPLSVVWEGMSNVYYAQLLNSAEGVNLDRAAEYSGQIRLPATYSVANYVEFYGDNLTNIPIGTQGSVSLTGEVFETIEAIQINQNNAYRAIVEITTVVIGYSYQLRLNGTVYSHTAVFGDTEATIVSSLVSLTASDPVFDVSGYPLGPSPYRMLIESKSTSSGYPIVISASNMAINKVSSLGEMQAVNAGSVIATSGTLNTIVTPVSGLDSISNTTDASVGNDIETDTNFRRRIKESHGLLGSATIEGMKSKLLQNVSGVTSVSIIENDTDSTVGSLPPHSFECVIEGGTDADVADGIFLYKPAGIYTYGTSSESVEDSMGFTHTINFSRPTPQYAWIHVLYTLNTEESFPSGGEATIADNILAIGDLYEPGDDLIIMKFYDAINSVSGVATATITVDTTATAGGPPSYGSSNIAIASNELAVFDLTRITVTT